MTDTEFLAEVKRHVQKVDEQAEVWLFGSRARGDAREDSDWDFLILLTEPVNRTIKSQIRDDLYGVELDSNQLIGTIIHSKDEWEADYAVTPLYRNIKRYSKRL